jgi:hypothetical protein
MLLNPYWYGAAGSATDPNFASVVLLCHFDGADGATNCVDSTGRHTVTGNSNSKLSTAEKKFGTASLAQSLTNSVNSADSADWSLGAGQFTVECWGRRSGALTTNLSVLVCQWGTAGNHSWILFLSSTDGLAFGYSTTGSNIVVINNPSYSMPTNQWVHYAADRDASNVIRVYADGVVVGSATAAVTFKDSTLQLMIGNDAGITRQWSGNIDDLRITKGVARYAGAFTPPTAPFPDA